MRHEGRLKKWNEERGFGFITADKDGSDFFVHISAFPPGERNPKIGERLSFEISTGPDGKKRATRISCPERTATRSAAPVRHHPQRQTGTTRQSTTRSWPRAILALTAIGLALAAYQKFSPQFLAPSPSTIHVLDGKPAALPAPPPAAHFQCDGRQHCSQMTSCNEAKFFLRNCPNTKMDGDGDGIPCEEQWCGH